MGSFSMENPLVGSFNRERTILVFRQRSLEVYCAYAGIFGGCFMFLYGVFRIVKGEGVSEAVLWFLFFGGAFALASLWAFLLFRSIKFDLRKRLYTERLGSAGRPTYRSGPIQEVRHLELMKYNALIPVQLSTGSPLSEMYVIRLVWQDPARPPATLEHVLSSAPYGTIDGALAGFGQKATSYASALGVPLLSTVSLPGLQRIS